ncbi:MAG: hypothetical protein V7640_1898, partial [Betaproteobacteria bacterium]
MRATRKESDKWIRVSKTHADKRLDRAGTLQ